MAWNQVLSSCPQPVASDKNLAHTSNFVIVNCDSKHRGCHPGQQPLARNSNFDIWTVTARIGNISQVSKSTCRGVARSGVVDFPVGSFGAICHPGSLGLTGQGGLHPYEPIAIGVLGALWQGLCVHLWPAASC